MVFQKGEEHKGFIATPHALFWIALEWPAVPMCFFSMIAYVHGSDTTLCPKGRKAKRKTVVHVVAQSVLVNTMMFGTDGPMRADPRQIVPFQHQQRLVCK